MRLAAVAAAAVERERERVRGRRHEAFLRAYVAGAERHYVSSEHDIGDWDFEIETVVDHCLGSGAALFSGLEAEDERAAPVLPGFDEEV